MTIACIANVVIIEQRLMHNAFLIRGEHRHSVRGSRNRRLAYLLARNNQFPDIWNEKSWIEYILRSIQRHVLFQFDARKLSDR